MQAWLSWSVIGRLSHVITFSRRLSRLALYPDAIRQPHRSPPALSRHHRSSRVPDLRYNMRYKSSRFLAGFC
jgi:hypothetical protein